MAVETPEMATPNPETPVTVERLFRYSAWIHLGDGAGECEHVDEEQGTNACTDPGHFHAWCRLPNALQEEQINEKALAAKGRRARLLRDPQTDANASLEAQLDLIAMEGDAVRDAVIAELLDRERWRDLLRATSEVIDMEEGQDDEGEPALPFAHVREDQRRLDELEALPEEDQQDVHDELVSLRSHLERYNELVLERNKAIVAPKRQALEDLDISDLLDKVRDLRISRDSSTAFANAYSRTVWLWCTLTAPRGTQVFANGGEMDTAAPEIIDALQRTYDDLQQAQAEVHSGN